MTESRTPRPDLENRQSRLNSWWKGTACAARSTCRRKPRPVGAVALAHGWSMVAGGDLEDTRPPSSSRAWRR